jgi:hypothetical protein
MAALNAVEAAAAATVHIVDAAGAHQGQGLLVRVGNNAYVLTCHHVVAPLSPDGIRVAVPSEDLTLTDPVPATYDEQRSTPHLDAAVLRITVDVPAAPLPLLHHLDPRRYDGTPFPVTAISYKEPGRFDAKLAAPARLHIPVAVAGPWRDAPNAYELPRVFRLADATDARPGTSGSVAVCEDGVLGLVHFARQASPQAGRESYVVPINTWSAGWPALVELLRPFADRRLRAAATVRRADELSTTTDLLVARYLADVWVERTVMAQARRAFDAGGVVIIGRPTSGKTRLAYELLRERPSALAILPKDRRPPDTFMVTPLDGQDVVLVLDDLHSLHRDDDLADWLDRLSERTGQTPFLLATSRDGEDWRQVLEQPRLRPRLEQVDRAYTSRYVTEGADLTTEEAAELAGALKLSPEDVTRRFDGTPGSLVLDFPAMRDRYRRLEERALGAVPQTRLLNAAKVLLRGDQPQFRGSLLRGVSEQVLGEDRLASDVWAALQRATAEESFGSIDRETGDLHIYVPYLEQSVTFEPTLEDMRRLQDVLLDEEDGPGLVRLGNALLAQFGSVNDAYDAIIAAGDRGQDLSRELAFVLSQKPGGAQEAEELHRWLIKQGRHGQWQSLGLLLQQQDRLDEAEEAFKEAIGAGHKWAGFNLGQLYRSQGRLDDAEAAYQRAEGAGLALAALQLALLLAPRSDRSTEAEALLRRVLAGRPYLSPLTRKEDLATAFETLGNVLARQPARAAEAAQAYQSAVDLRSQTVANNLTN